MGPFVQGTYQDVSINWTVQSFPAWNVHVPKKIGKTNLKSINIRRESRTRRFFCHNGIRTNSDTAVKEHIYWMGKTRFSLRVLLSCQNVLEIPKTLWCKYNTMDKWASVASFVQSWLALVGHVMYLLGFCSFVHRTIDEFYIKTKSKLKENDQYLWQI